MMAEQCFRGLEDEGFRVPADRLYRGKVRDCVTLGDEMLLVTSDRISAFDRVLGVIRHKGEILNRLACHWLEASADIVPNHLIKRVGPRSMLVRRASVLPVEVIVRGYLTGSAWRDYSAGKAVSGIVLPANMRRNQKFDAPLITPSTKAADGDHDTPISREEILERGIVSESLWRQVEEYALKLFAFGSKEAARRGLLLVDTKYEFGIDSDGRLLVVDEVHTPDSSRFWYAASYDEKFEKGADPRALDKEFLRAWLLERGFSGEGTPPVLDDSIRNLISLRYQELFALVTGQNFESLSVGIEAERQELAVIIQGS